MPHHGWQGEGWLACGPHLKRREVGGRGASPTQKMKFACDACNSPLGLCDDDASRTEYNSMNTMCKA